MLKFVDIYCQTQPILIKDESSTDIHLQLDDDEWCKTNRELCFKMRTPSYYQPSIIQRINETLDRSRDKTFDEVIKILCSEKYGVTDLSEVEIPEMLSIQINGHKVGFGMKFLYMARYLNSEQQKKLLIDRRSC